MGLGVPILKHFRVICFSLFQVANERKVKHAFSRYKSTEVQRSIISFLCVCVSVVVVLRQR